MARYMELRQTLAAEIAAGVPPVGARFPTDLELCERFGVSRHTVREALRDLQDQGLLVRQRGSGTVVADPAARGVYSQTVASLAELDAYAADAHFAKASEGVVVARPALADLLACAPDTKWLRLAGLRRLEGASAPLAWTELFFAEPYISARGQLVMGPEPFYEQLRRLFGVTVTEVEQTISAVSIPPDIAASLETPAGGPALLVRRRYFAGADLVEISLSIHPAERYAYTQRLSRG